MGQDELTDTIEPLVAQPCPGLAHRRQDGASRPVLLLVHGAWFGGWSWEKVQTELVARGWQVRTVDLLSVADRGYLRLGLHDDAEMVRQRIKEINGPVVVVAHSYGGARAASKSWVCRGIALHGHDVVVDVPPVGFTAAEP